LLQSVIGDDSVEDIVPCAPSGHRSPAVLAGVLQADC
jgi:hypothetical protein